MAGAYDPMIADAEILKILCEALTALDIGEYTVKVNRNTIWDRKNILLTYIFSSIIVRSWMVSLKSVVSLRKRFDPSLLLSTSWIRYKKWGW